MSGQQLTSQSVVTSTTWLNAWSDPIEIHYNFTNLLASPTATAFETRFSFTEDTPDTSLGTNLTNTIDAPTGFWATWNGTATANGIGTALGPRRHESRISTEEIAGLGIGSAAAGALLVSLAACLLLRRRLRRRAYSFETLSSSSDSAKDSEKLAAIPLTTIPLEGLSSTLPQPEADRTIIASVSKLDTVIKNHTHSFYAHSATVQSSGEALPLLEKLLHNCADMNAQDLNTVLSNAETRVGAVRFLMAWSTLSNIGYNSQVDHTLLPPALAECLSAMHLKQESSSGEDPGNETRHVHGLHRLALLSKWRHLTGALMPPSKTMLPDEPRHFNIGQLAKDLDGVLRYCASPDGNGRLANMTEIIRQGAYVGYVLFVHPTAWVFEWGHEAGNELVVFPALVQMSDEHGRPQARPVRSANVQRVSRGKRNEAYCAF
ncbi:hypothetical protein AC579_6893 [Pseudocercospora musae]|uniref:Uncharacterized protein n=1 Tax=Pseudocercospora musae TaxID=113226 RepID=A0A139IGI4_9PEZI|nr:hypothetical protein AC579_6893 [Pseudocercospora musae]